QLVHALSVRRVPVGEEVGARTSILRCPARAAVIGTIDTTCGQRAVDAASVARVVLDGMQGEAATGRLPGRTRLVAVQGIDAAPACAPVVTHEQAGRLDAGIHAVGRLPRAGCEEPDRGEAALIVVMRGLLEQMPRLAEVVA